MYEFLITSLIGGVVLAFIAYALMIPFRLISLPDLTAEGAYPLGGGICAVLLNSGINSIIAILIAAIISGLLGLATGFFYLRFKIQSLLSGIIISTMSYSVTLRIIGKPNIGLFNVDRLFFIGENGDTINLFILLLILVLVILPFFVFLYTESGLRLRTLGFNVEFAKRYTISIPFYTLICLFFSASLAGMAGGLMVQIQQYMDIGMGVGIVIHALAALMIGESVLGDQTISRRMLSPLVGALLYKQIQGMVILAGLAPSDLRFFTGFFVLIILEIKRNKLIKQ